MKSETQGGLQTRPHRYGNNGKIQNSAPKNQIGPQPYHLTLTLRPLCTASDQGRVSPSPRAAARTWPVTALPWTRPGAVSGEEGWPAGTGTAPAGLVIKCMFSEPHTPRLRPVPPLMSRSQPRITPHQLAHVPRSEPRNNEWIYYVHG